MRNRRKRFRSILGAKLLRKKGARILAAERSLELIRNPPRIPAYRRIVWEQPEGVDAEAVNDIAEVCDLAVQVIETPRAQL